VPRRLAENVTATFPLFALLFVPVVLGMGRLFPWSSGAAEHEGLLRGTEGFLNPPFFLIRAAVYLLSWIALSLFFLRASRRQDETGDVATTLRLIRISAPALFVFAITVTFAAVDWIMSLDPHHWYSTIFGVYFFAGSLVAIFAFLAILGAVLRRGGLMTSTLTIEHLHDLGKLLFAFTVFWAYIGFSQYFLIWYGNIPEETTFFRHRLVGSWSAVSFLLAAGHFVVPFFFFMPRTIKRKPALLAAGAG